MNQAELKTALEDISTALTDAAAQLDKGINEVIIAIQNSGNTSQEVDAAVTSLQAKVAALKAATQTLDDLNPDS